MSEVRSVDPVVFDPETVVTAENLRDLFLQAGVEDGVLTPDYLSQTWEAIVVRAGTKHTAMSVSDVLYSIGAGEKCPMIRESFMKVRG